MTIHRSEIENALGDLISDESGMRFQGLAVVLAKQRWPDLIACERHNDMGADALAKADFAADGVGKVLACSNTATLGKIRMDAEKVRADRTDITKLIFATPSAVTNAMGEKWATEIQRDFGYALAIMSREDFVTSLMDPHNSSLLKSHLGIHLNLGPALSELVKQVREAAAEVSAAWHQRIAGEPLLELRAMRLGPDGKDSAEALGLEELRVALGHGRRIVLEGPAGRGKTTTLIQIAKTSPDVDGTAVLVDLPAWAMKKSGILQFIAGMPQFQARSIDETTLARVNTVEHFSFLLNGWNEIAGPDFSHANIALRTLEQAFPAAGIIVATRTHQMVPPLPGATRARLLTLTKHERAFYLNARLGRRALELRFKLDGDPVLDDLTRTPLFLSAIASLFEKGELVPPTKFGVLGAVTHLAEQSSDHLNYLREPPISSLSKDYLGELAIQMTARGGVSLSEHEARPAVTHISARLKDAGQIALMPDPGSILGVLCAHHVLERQDYPEIAFRFEHQQFQEFYAAVALGKRLFAVAQTPDEEKTRDFTGSYVNDPAWSEPLRLLADDVGGRSATKGGDGAIQAGAHLVMMALSVDPVFAAELARLCGKLVWQQVREAVGGRLRSLYASLIPHYSEYAIAGMLTSGSDDFKDLIEPILSGDHRQAIRGAFWGSDEFYVSSLGICWQDKVSAWNEAARAAFVSDILLSRNSPEIVAFVLADQSIRVKQAAVQGLGWIGADNNAARILDSLDESGFCDLVDKLAPDLIPPTARDRAYAALHRRHKTAVAPIERLGISLRMAELGLPSADQVKKDLSEVTGTLDNRAIEALKPALDLVRKSDGAWASAWVAERIADGTLRHQFWEDMITEVPERLIQDLLGRLETENLTNAPSGNIIAVLRAAANVPIAARVFKRLCELRRTISSGPVQAHVLEWAIERQLDGLLRALPAAISVGGMATSFSKPIDPIELDVITRVFSSVALSDTDPLKDLDGNLREQFRTYLREAVPCALNQDDFSGSLKANLGSVLASIGLPEDLRELSELIRADIERVRRGQAARARGDRGKLGSGAAMSYALWHIRSVIRLDSTNTDTILTDLLGEPEYEAAVADGFVRLAAPPAANVGLLRQVDYEQIWRARAGVQRESHNARRLSYASALRNRIETIWEERSAADDKRLHEYRLIVLGSALATIDSRGSADLVFKVMSLPGIFLSYSRVQAFETLLFQGVALPADITLTLFDSFLEQRRKYGFQQHEEGPLEQLLCLLPFVDDPARGIERMRQLLSEPRIYGHHFRGPVAALGHCRNDHALPFLIEIVSDKARAEQIGDAWIDAVAAVDTHESRSLLLSFVDPFSAVVPAEIGIPTGRALVARLVELAKRDRVIEQRLIQFCGTELPPAKRALLAKIAGEIGGLEAVSAGLNLIDDTDNTPVPYEIWEQIEVVFVERRPHGKSEGTFSLEPKSANAIRARLFEMATQDKRRERSALSLLAQIETWRLQYGRPVGEPRHPAFDSGAPWPPTPPW